MFHTVTKQERPGSRTINFVTLGETFLLHRQVEQRGAIVFMRAKRRSFPDIQPN